MSIKKFIMNDFNQQFTPYNPEDSRLRAGDERRYSSSNKEKPHSSGGGYTGLTKKERKLLKRQQKEEERLRLIRRKKTKKIIGILIIAFIIGVFITGAGYLIFGIVTGSSEENHKGTPKIEVNPKEYDAGTISMAAGLVKYTYEIKNNGDGDLKIEDVRTSCACTTAILQVGDKKSPKFGMPGHGVNPIGWSQKIALVEIGKLEVTFDPAFHGLQGTGPVERLVIFSTNDPENKEIQLKLLANVVE